MLTLLKVGHLFFSQIKCEAVRTFLKFSRFYFRCSQLFNQKFSFMEIVLLILTVLVIFSCLSAWFNAAELDTDDENF